MGMNFYLHEDICPQCGRGATPLHIGKSSYGWCFALHVIPELGITCLGDWQERWKNGVIKDEWNDVVSPKEMMERITKRFGSTNIMWTDNYAIQGPNGLARRVLGGDCIGHGPGTWDLITGDFS